MASRTEIKLGEYTFFVKKFAALDALRIVGNLQQRVIGPAARLIATQRNEVATDDDFARGIQEFSKALDGDTLLWAFKTLVNPDHVSIQPQGDEAAKLTENAIAQYEIPLDVLLALTIEVAKVNFLDFGKSAGGLFGLVRSRTSNQNQPV